MVAAPLLTKKPSTRRTWTPDSTFYLRPVWLPTTVQADVDPKVAARTKWALNCAASSLTSCCGACWPSFAVWRTVRQVSAVALALRALMGETCPEQGLPKPPGECLAPLAVCCIYIVHLSVS